MSPDLAALERRITRLEDRTRIQDLIAAYAIAVDDCDIDAVVAMFTADGTFEREGAVSHGHDEIRAFYRAAIQRYTFTLHVPESDQIVVDGDTGRGLLTGQAELALGDAVVLAAYRYRDRYVRESERWLFAGRQLCFRYALPVEQFQAGLTSPQRIRWP